MAKTSKLLLEMQDRYFNAGLETGKQIAADSFELAMQDVGISKSKILETVSPALEYSTLLERAIETKRNPEADVIQEKADRKLRDIFGEKFVPFEKRYGWIRKCRY